MAAGVKDNKDIFCDFCIALVTWVDDLLHDGSTQDQIVQFFKDTVST